MKLIPRKIQLVNHTWDTLLTKPTQIILYITRHLTHMRVFLLSQKSLAKGPYTQSGPICFKFLAWPLERRSKSKVESQTASFWPYSHDLYRVTLHISLEWVNHPNFYWTSEASLSLMVWQDAYCEFHLAVQRHSIKNCKALKYQVQALIEERYLNFEKELEEGLC